MKNIFIFFNQFFQTRSNAFPFKKFRLTKKKSDEHIRL